MLTPSAAMSNFSTCGVKGLDPREENNATMGAGLTSNCVPRSSICAVGFAVAFMYARMVVLAIAPT